jgi:hypothetical protein
MMRVSAFRLRSVSPIASRMRKDGPITTRRLGLREEAFSREHTQRLLTVPDFAFGCCERPEADTCPTGPCVLMSSRHRCFVRFPGIDLRISSPFLEGRWWKTLFRSILICFICLPMNSVVAG